jgi:2-oxoisovalerate ferredoxin oxidoreductase beta subunit
MSVFYEKFMRHAGGVGLKAKSTHYCPGCGHGLAHKYLAEAIEELDIQDRTIAISPVGCSVFLYYYFDVGNTQAAHGRAPAVAIGHKTANPNSIVVSYQGDGDLASIGLAEIIQAAQMGIPITVIFINNATYAMTGGQLAPTSLMNMKTTTTPYGRSHFMGEPLKMAELIAQLDGPVYVERVALYDNKQRMRAKKAIKKALQLQVDNVGFAFIEVLAECPTHLKMSTAEAQQWVKEQMVPVFPLGVKKEATETKWEHLNPPNFDAQTLVNLICQEKESAPTFSRGFPVHIDANDVSLKLAGAGGDGAQTAAHLIARAAINEGFDATHIPSYGPESRGGTSFADVHIAKTEVLTPSAPNPHILVAFNNPSLSKFGPTVREKGLILYDSSVVTQIPELSNTIRIYGVPFSEIAKDIGSIMVKNIVALGALCEATYLFPAESFIYAISQALADKCSLLPLNEAAFREGAKAFQHYYPSILG